MDPLAPLLDFARAHRRLVVLTGAGCSTASGIPDYRDADGQWKRSEPMRFQLFVADALARKRYWARSMLGWRTMSQARPALAHRALASMEAAGRISLLVTQNVDGLHGAAGSRQVVDLHGRIDTVCCLQCGARTPRAALQSELEQRNPQWAQLHAHAAPDGDADLDIAPNPGCARPPEGVRGDLGAARHLLMQRDFAQFDVPPCADCGGVLKPDVVFFGESVPRERVAAVRTALATADALLVAGSSLMVYSGYRFVEDALALGKPVAVLNRGRTRADAVLTLKVEQDAGTALDALARCA